MSSRFPDDTFTIPFIPPEGKALLFILWLLLVQMITPWESTGCWALTPENIVVVANKEAPHSVELAKYYMKGRHIPLNHLIEIKAPTEENCSRKHYEKYIALPIKAFLKENDPQGIKYHCLVTIYGVPLRVDPPKLTSEERGVVRVT